MRKYLRAAAAMLMALMLMPLPVHAAANGAKDPVQDKSSDTATIYLSKILTVSQSGKFPDATDFHFGLEAVKAWDNANALASANGKTIPKEEMPMPATSAADHQKVILTDKTTAEIVTGNFSGQANTKKADTDTEKLRVTPVRIKFTKAGYYVYKLNEIKSVPENIPGMSYDHNSYYVVVYVCNKTDDNGNTIPGVYVHDITSYRNDSMGSDYQADLSDIQNVTDNKGTPAKENNYDNYAKVGKSDPDPGTDPETGNPKGPDKLDAYKFFNDMTTHDVVVTNNVTGNLGDITKEFEFKVTITGLEKNKTYTTSDNAQDKTVKHQTSQGADLITIAGGKGTVDPTARTFTSDSDGNATFMIKLKDDEVMVFNALPATATYTVEELASDHIASFTSESTEPDTWVMVLKEKANNHSDTALSTATEVVDAVSNVPGRDQNASDDNDGTVTINFRNHRDLTTPTGLPYYGDFVYVMMGIMAAAAVLLAARVKTVK